MNEEISPQPGLNDTITFCITIFVFVLMVGSILYFQRRK